MMGTTNGHNDTFLFWGLTDTMKYMFLIHGKETGWTEPERESCMVESMEICRELERMGKWITSSPLLPVSTAQTVHASAGKRWVTSGPFAETAEQLGGFYILDFEDLDEAISVASRLPPASKGTVEIRPMHDHPRSREDRFECLESLDGNEKAYLIMLYAPSAVSTMDDFNPSTAMASAASVLLAISEKVGPERWIGDGVLHSPEVATCVRIRDQRRIVSDGTSEPDDEPLMGFSVILAASIEDAVAVLTETQESWEGPMEVRALFDLSPLKHRLVSN